MKRLGKKTFLFLTLSSGLLGNAAQALVCPVLTQEDMRTICRSVQYQRAGMEAGTVVVAGVRFVNHKNCGQWDTAVTTLKTKKAEHFEGTFHAIEGVIEPGHLKTQGYCRYQRPRLLKGEKSIDFYVLTEQKVLFAGVQANPMAGSTPPKIGGEAVVNPDEPKQKRNLLEAAKGKAKDLFGKPKPPPAPPPPPTSAPAPMPLPPASAPAPTPKRPVPAWAVPD